MDFNDEDISQTLGLCDDDTLNALEFGVVAMTLDGVVVRYNAYESRLAGLSPSRVLGKNFFSEVAPCTNNYLVASRFEECATLDEQLAYVFTLRMRPRNVDLRLIKALGSEHQYILVRGR